MENLNNFRTVTEEEIERLTYMEIRSPNRKMTSFPIDQASYRQQADVGRYAITNTT